MIGIKDKEIRQLNKQLSRLNDEQTNKDMIISALQRKDEETTKNQAVQEQNLKSLKETLKFKERSLTEINSKYDTLAEEKEKI